MSSTTTTSAMHTGKEVIESRRETAAMPTARTRLLASCGVLAAFLFAIVALVQVAMRPGFDLLRHPVSLLSVGELGWIQIVNFVVSGALMIACAAGLRGVLRGGQAGTWGPILVGVQGFGFVTAGMFTMDPYDGFPVGTPAGAPSGLSGHALGHMVAGSVAFLAMIIACFVLARRLSAERQRAWAMAGRICGLLFLAGLAWSNAGGRAGSLTLFVGTMIAWAFIAATAARLASAMTSVTSR
jgi:hypothetical membrane protein